MKERYRIGELYRVINEQGDDVGLGVLLGIHEPGSLSLDEVNTFGLWNMSILLDGTVRYYSTSHWTLAPADCL